MIDRILTTRMHSPAPATSSPPASSSHTSPAPLFREASRLSQGRDSRTRALINAGVWGQIASYSSETASSSRTHSGRDESMVASSSGVGSSSRPPPPGGILSSSQTRLLRRSSSQESATSSSNSGILSNPDRLASSLSSPISSVSTLTAESSSITRERKRKRVRFDGDAKDDEGGKDDRNAYNSKDDSYGGEKRFKSRSGRVSISRRFEDEFIF